MRDDQPVTVTHHGRPTHVLMTAARYAEMQDAGSDEAEGRIGPGMLQEFAACLGQGVLIIDDRMVVLVANRVAQAMLDRVGVELVGRRIFDAVPALQGSLIETYVRRAVRTKEPGVAEIPSAFRKGSWVRVEVYPFAHHATILFHDITDDMTRHRLADARTAMRAAIAVDDHISYVCLNMRGHIDSAEPSFCDLTQLPEDRLHHVALADLIPVSHRANFREVLNAVLTGGGAQTIDTVVLANDGMTVDVRITMAELRGAYGNEGAVVLLTKLT
jgi:PAS domain-containing protein